MGFHVGTSLDLLLLLHLGQGPVAGLPLLPLQVVHLLDHFAGPVSIHLFVLEIGVVEEPENSNIVFILSSSSPSISSSTSSSSKQDKVADENEHRL